MSAVMDKWDQQTPIGKSVLVLLLLAIFLVPIVMFYSLYSPKLVPLYQGLAEQDAAKIVTQLDANKVEYKLRNSGRDIYIHEAQANDARLQLVSDGVQLGGGVGFEIFDDMDYGMTEFAQKINFQRALQGELSRTISSHESIKYARVHLVLPEATLFERETKQPKASVTLVVESNLTLSNSQIQGIQYLISNSVEGLSPERVIVNDSNGNVLSVASLEDDFSLGTVMSKKQELEVSLAEKCNAILVKIFGENKTIVNVDVALTSAEVKRRTESILAGENGASGVLVSKKRSITKKQNKSSKSKTNSQNNLSELEELSYKTGTQIEETVYGAGQIKRISISALIPVGVTDNQLADITALLKSTAGFDEQRGDAIAVKRLPLLSSRVAQIDKPITKSAVVGYENTISTAPELKADRYGFIAGALGILVALIAIAISLFNNRNSSLSAAERQVVLANVKNWIESDSAVIEGEKVS